MAEFVYSYAPLTLPSPPRGERLKSIRCLPPVDPLTVCTRVHILAAMKKEYDFSKGRRGAVLEAPPGKTRITIRIDDDILRWFRTQVDRAGGGSYQSLINQALRDFVKRSREPLESTLRRVIREELRRAG